MTAPIATPNMEKTVTDYTDERMAALTKQAEDANMMLVRAEAQNDYKARIIQVFSRMLEFMGDDFSRSEWDDAIAACQTMPREQIIGLLIEHGIVDEDTIMTEYLVTLTVPVSVTIRVDGTNEEDAEERALNEFDNCYITDYDLDYDSYNLQVTYVEEA